MPSINSDHLFLSNPTRVGAITPINSTVYEYDSSGLYAENLTGNGQSLITAGCSWSSIVGVFPTYNINIFDLENGQLVNHTSHWFSGLDNQIIGTAPSVKFADFNGDGRLDMFVSPFTENGLTGELAYGWLFLNNGSSFTRIDLGLSRFGHDSAVFDINGDGYYDIYLTGGLVAFGSSDGTFISHVAGGPGGSVALGDFIGSGVGSVILTDQNSFYAGGTVLYSWELSEGGRPTLDFSLSLIATLPASRFFLSKWDSYNFSGSHDYRILALDFDNSGLEDVIVFSRPVQRDLVTWNITWPEYSEIQFLKNKGNGVFEDVTDSTLIGYDNTSPCNYFARLQDINNDGLTDIVLGGTGWNDAGGAMVLLQTPEHKYVVSYVSEINNFLSKALALEKIIHPYAQGGANGVSFIQGPDNSTYLATAVSYSENGIQQKAFYTSKLGSEIITTDQSSTPTSTTPTNSGIENHGISMLSVQSIGLSSDGLYLLIKVGGITSLVSRGSSVSFTEGNLTTEELSTHITPIPVFKSSGGTGGYALPDLYTGPASLNLKYQLIESADNAVVTGSSFNEFIKVSSTNSVRSEVNGNGGSDVIDGGVGSTFVTGGTGHSDTFFLDGRAPGTSWSTITDFKMNTDKATIWGFVKGVSSIDTSFANYNSEGAAGYTGLTLHFKNLLPDGQTSGSNANLNSITFSGHTLAELGASSLADLNSQINAGTNAHILVGSTQDSSGTHSYLYIH